MKKPAIENFIAYMQRACRITFAKNQDGDTCLSISSSVFFYHRAAPLIF